MRRRMTQQEIANVVQQVPFFYLFLLLLSVSYGSVVDAITAGTPSNVVRVNHNDQNLSGTTQGARRAAAPWQPRTGTTPTSSSSSSSNINFDDLPPNVFAPGGRLHSVERNIEKANSEGDITSNLVVALQCQDGLVIVSTATQSPHLSTIKMNNNQDNKIDTNNKEEENNLTQNDEPLPSSSSTRTTKNDYRQSLWINDNDHDNNGEESTHTDENGRSIHMSSLFTTASSLNTDVIACTGGCATDSLLLKNKIENLMQYMIEENDGGGGIGSSSPSSLTVTNVISPSLLARRIADILQETTQTIGQMLASSALIVGPRRNIGIPHETDDKEENHAGGNNNNNRIDSSSSSPPPFYIWRIDPTGQFWDCYGTTIGRGARIAENHLVQLLTTSIQKQNKEKHTTMMNNNSDNSNEHMQQQKQQNDETEKEEIEALQKDIPMFLSNLSAKEALQVACQCIVNTLKLSEKKSFQNKEEVVASKEGDDTKKEKGESNDSNNDIKKSISKEQQHIDHDDDTWNHMEAVILTRKHATTPNHNPGHSSSTTNTVVQTMNGSELFQIYHSNNKQ